MLWNIPAFTVKLTCFVVMLYCIWPTLMSMKTLNLIGTYGVWLTMQMAEVLSGVKLQDFEWSKQFNT